MKASLIITGTEITRGLVQDSHLKNISSMLGTVGVEVDSVFFIPDSDKIRKYIDFAAESSDIIITTGGLGPTDDDITRFAVADFAGVKLESNAAAYDNVLKAVGVWKCCGSNLIQSRIPAGFEIIYNANGSACGFFGIAKEKLVVSLPGPPRELNPMLSSVREVVCRFAGRKEEAVFTYTLFAVPEAHFNDLSKKILSGMPGLNVGTCFEEFRLLVYVYSSDETVAIRYISALKKLLAEEENDVDFVFDGDCSLFTMLAGNLQGKGLKISVAESITGGLIAKCFTDIPGSSQWFASGIVSYSDKVKNEELGVQQPVLDNYGAVSAQCVSQMASGAENKFKSDISIAVSGYAGPDGADIGLVYMAVKQKGEEAKVFKHRFAGSNRNFIRKRTAVFAVLHALRLLA